MNAERLAQYQNVESIPAQNAIIKNSTTFKKHEAYYDAQFVPGFFIYDWKEEFAGSVASAQNDQVGLSPDGLKLEAVAVNQGAQFGFDTMEGQVMSGVHSPFDPWRILATACHIASLNTKAFALKHAMSDEYEKTSVEAAVGIFGVMFRSKFGEIIDPLEKSKRDTYWFDKAVRRAGSNRKVLVPHTKLNNALVGLEFTSHMADTMSDHDLEVTMIPRVVEVLGEYLDPGLAFFTTRRAPLRVYSIPNSNL